MVSQLTVLSEPSNKIRAHALMLHSGGLDLHESSVTLPSSSCEHTRITPTAQHEKSRDNST